MEYEFEFEKKKIFNMKSFIKLYLGIFAGLAILTYVIYSLSLRIIFGDHVVKPQEDVLGSQVELEKKTDSNTIVINPNRSKEKNESRLEISNGIAADYIFLFDNENHGFIEGETVPDRNIFLTLGEYKVTKKSNPDGFFSIELPKESDLSLYGGIKQFQKGIIELKDDNFQIIKSYSFIFVLRKFLNRIYFVNTKENSVFSIEAPLGYQSTLGNYQSIDNGLCALRHTLDKYITDFNNPDENTFILPQPLSVEKVTKKEYAIFTIANTNSIYELTKCVSEIKTLDLKIQWHNDIIKTLIAGSEDLTEQTKGIATTVSDPIN